MSANPKGVALQCGGVGAGALNPGSATAIAYTLIETAKLNGVDTYA